MQKPKRLNQSTIAKATGVSRATVSLVLRGGLGSSATTKAKVLAAAEKMGYRPNALVHSIRSGKSRSVGILVPPYDTHWKSVCHGIHDSLIEADHLPLFLWNNNHQPVSPSDFALKQIHRLLDRWVDGVILSPEFSSHCASHLHEFEKRNIPLIIIDHHLPALTADLVGSDESEIARLAVSHLIEQGHRSYLILSGPEDIGWAEGRCRHFHLELAKHPDCTSHNLRLPLAGDRAGIISDTFQKIPSITAVLAATDYFAQQAYVAAEALAWRIPQRLSIVGVGNLNFSRLLSPPLTTIDQEGYQVGQKAAQVVLHRSSGILSTDPQHFTLPVKWIHRESTGPVPQL